MSPLLPERIEYIVVHSAGTRLRNVDARELHRVHRQRGWRGIGHHFVILDGRHDRKRDGTVERGRPITEAGAHTAGLNDRSIGICCVGQGDREPLTPAQLDALVDLVQALRARYGVALRNVIGHAEVNELVRRGELAADYRVRTTCPGARIDMAHVRARLREARPGHADRMEGVQAALPEQVWLPNVPIFRDEARVSD